jgi:LPXTG-motif cell wall-anchored protein
MRNNLIYIAIISCATFLIELSAHAQQKTEVKATVDRSQILIGEPIHLTLEVDVPEHEPIRFFQVDSLPHFEFLNRPEIDTANTGTGTRLRQVISLTSFDSGHWVIPALPLGDQLSTDSIPVDVGFAPFDPAQPYHDIKDIIEVTPVEKKEAFQWWYLVAGAAALIIILFLVFRKKKKQPVQVVVPPPDPYKKALSLLEQLQKNRPEPKQYYSELVDIFRVYVLAKTGIHSLQNTTDDLVRQLKGLAIPKDGFEQLAQSLRLSDLVKFAKFDPSSNDDETTFQAIKRSINQIEELR